MSHTRTAGRIAALIASLLVVSMVPTAVVASNHQQNLQVSITSPSDGATVQRADVVTLSAVATHSNCPPGSWEWRIGTTVIGTSQNMTYSFQNAGANVLTVKVTGTGGCTRSKEASVTVHVTNLAPTAALAAPSTAVAGSAITLDASGSSDDRAVTSYVFTVDGVQLPAQSTPTLARTFTLAGPHTASVQVFDGDGANAASSVVSIDVLAGPVAAITVSGPATVVAGSSESFDVSGVDAYGNAATLASSSFLFVAPTAVGPATACYTEGDVTGCAEVDVVAGELAIIVVSGPATVVAGAVATFDVAGADAHGNPVALSVSSFEWTAPTQVGSQTVSYAEGDVAGELVVTVVAGPLASISVSGPSTMVAGTSASFDVAGADAHGNPVVLAVESFAFTAPTLAGAAQACYEEADVSSCADVDVVADALATIVVSGAETIVAGTTSEWSVAGFDQYGNSVALAQSTVSFTAPTSVGTVTVTYAEGDVAGELSVEVVADALASIVVSGPESLAAGATGSFPVAGFDQYGNAVALAVPSVLHTAGQSVGTETVSYTEQGITGTKTIRISPVALSVTVEMSQPRYAPADALLTGISGTVSVNFPGAGPMEGAQVRVVVLRTVPLVGYVQNETFTGTTAADGTFSFTPSPAFSLVGDYVIIVRANALGNAGIASGQYRVGL